MSKTRERRIGLGFDPPGTEDVFADASTAVGRGQPQTNIPRWRLDANGEIIAADSFEKVELASENEKAERVAFEKRVFGIAKQAVAALQGIGVRYEMTTVANIVRAACKFRTLDKAEQRAMLEKDKAKGELVRACGVLDACLQFDATRLANLLELVVKQEKTFGEGVPL